MIRQNIGSIDRAARLIVGMALITITFTGPKTMWGLIGIIPFITALFSWCPAYTLLGVSTCKECLSEERDGNSGSDNP